MIEIKHKTTGALLYKSKSAAWVHQAVEEVGEGANLRGADIREADV